MLLGFSREKKKFSHVLKKYCVSDFFRNFSVRNNDFSGFCCVQRGTSPTVIIRVNKPIISHPESISRGSGRFSGGRCELSHDFKRNPICTFISANKGYFAVL